MATGTENPGGNGGNGSALKNMNWPTVILILLSGGTNFFATKQNSSDREYQIQRAVSQIRELHEALDDSIARQKIGVERTAEILKKEEEILHRLPPPPP